MKLEIPIEILKNHPIQLIETTTGIILRRGVTQIKIEGEKAGEIVQIILSFTEGAGSEKEEIINYFAEPFRENINELIQTLLDKRFIFAEAEGSESSEMDPETELEVFYWNFATKPLDVSGKINARRIIVFGVNSITRRMAETLPESGFENYQIIDFAPLRNAAFFHADGSLNATKWPVQLAQPLSYSDWIANLAAEEIAFLIAACDFGGTGALRQWNEFAVKNEIPYFPILLQNLIGFVGPSVFPGETPCLECARGRLNANQNDFQIREIADSFAQGGEFVNGFLPPLGSVLGDIAVVELIRNLAEPFGKRMFGRMIEVNLLRGQMDNHKVLKLPRCRVCSGMNQQPQNSVDKTAYMPVKKFQSLMSFNNLPQNPLGNLESLAELLIDERTGILQKVEEIARNAGDPDFFQFSGTACNTQAFVREENFGNTGGASIRREVALAKAIGEGVERYCSAIFDVEDLPLCSQRDADFPTADPASFNLFSEEQYQQPGFQWVPFTPDTPVRWTPTLDMQTRKTVWVPGAMVFIPYFFYQGSGDAPILQPISTGLACHGSFEQAAIGGICEVIERDAFTITWQAKMSRPQIRVETLSDENYDLVNRFERNGSKVVLLDLSMDHGVPTVLSVLRGQSENSPALVFAASSDPNPETAVRKALEELAHTRRYSYQLKISMEPVVPDPPEHGNIHSQVDHLLYYTNYENARQCDFIFASKDRINFSDLPDLSTGDSKKDLEILLERIYSTGEKVFLADVTSPDVSSLGLTVVRAIIPGYHPLRMGFGVRSLGGKRLWEIPQKLGFPGIRRETGDVGIPHPYP